ncbi:MAG TPA: RNA polymerase sigma factor region1.1 domain-containing protein, partial [Candidatus Binatia bacterium]|nr:RNA polymerase sigma factor region1.1 domain-containing protein [Candidatus Binatia bacterium]
MANEASAEEQSVQQAEAPEKDSPLLDLSDAAVKEFIKIATARGYITHDGLNAVLPSEEVSSEQIEDTMSMLSDMGITVVESEDHEGGAAAPDGGDETSEDDAGGRAVAISTLVPAITQARTEPAERTDDPVRMYLRDMGSVEILSRQGETAIAKRIEAGREAMIAGLCESPLTFQAIII